MQEKWNGEVPQLVCVHMELTNAHVSKRRKKFVASVAQLSTKATSKNILLLLRKPGKANGVLEKPRRKILLLAFHLFLSFDTQDRLRTETKKYKSPSQAPADIAGVPQTSLIPKSGSLQTRKNSKSTKSSPVSTWLPRLTSSAVNVW